MFYLQGCESLSDLQINELDDTDKIQTTTQENMKKQDLFTFTGKMLLFTWASALQIDGDVSGYDQQMVQEFELIAKNNSDLMKEWLKSVAVIVDSRTDLANAVELLNVIPDKMSTTYKNKSKLMVETRKINEEKEYEYKTQNAFILYEQYFNFRKKKFLYGEEVDRLSRITHDDNTLYDDSDVSAESSSDDDL